MSDASPSQIQSWIEGLKNGDPAAREAMIHHAYDRLIRLTRKLLRDFRRLERWEDAEDVLQNALLRLLNALRDAPPSSPVQFFRLATLQIRRELYDLARHHFGKEGSAAHHASVTPSEPGTPAYEPPQSTYAPDRLAMWAELHRRIETLPPEERDVFELRWYQGLTVDEVSAALGISTPTVKRRWAASRLTLAEFLSDSR